MTHDVSLPNELARCDANTPSAPSTATDAELQATGVAQVRLLRLSAQLAVDQIRAIKPRDSAAD